MNVWAMPVADHLWQSTLFLIVVWGATLSVRRNAARVRCWLWTAASIKFLVPLSALVALVERVRWPGATDAPGPTVAFVMDDILAPATDVAAPQVAVFDTPTEALLGTLVDGMAGLVVAVWAIGTLVVLVCWWRQWRPIGAALRQATPIALDASYGAGDLAVVSAPAMPEPGVVGIWRPRLVLPDGLVERLAPAQLRALIAHERCHVRHHDNLVAAVQMVVEAIFWFHPAVWWIESRLIDERERACDETVLESGNRPEDYAEGILEVCRQSVSLRLACVAGVSGSNLRARVEAIMRREIGTPLTRPRQWALVAAIALATGGPVVGGVLLAQSRVVVPPDAPKFDTIMVRSAGPAPTTRPPNGPMAFEMEANLVRAQLAGPGNRELRVTGFPLRSLIQAAYRVPRFQIEGGPAWVTSELFAIEATAAVDVPPEQAVERLQSLLADRFKLVMRRETRTMPVYELTGAPGGLKIAPLRPGDCIPRGELRWDTIDLAAPLFVCGGGGRMRMLSQSPETRPFPRWPRVMRFEFGGIEMAQFMRHLASHADRPIVDRTGHESPFNLLLDFAPADDPKASGPSLFTALEEQLGLRLVEAEAPIEMLVIESAERPQ